MRAELVREDVILSKGVYRVRKFLSLIIGVVMATATGVWFFASYAQRLAVVEDRMQRLEDDIHWMRDQFVEVSHHLDVPVLERKQER